MPERHVVTLFGLHLSQAMCRLVGGLRIVLYNPIGAKVRWFWIASNTVASNGRRGDLINSQSAMDRLRGLTMTVLCSSISLIQSAPNDFVG